MKKKLQVFVSSTYLDLKDERQAAVEGILNAGHIPAGMELFAAEDAAQWEVIKRWIRESDVLLLLLGERYGSIEPSSGKSYIHLEFEYAKSQGIPVIALVLSEDAIKKKFQDLARHASDDHRALHADFKALVRKQLSPEVTTHQDIHLQILKSLRNFENDDSISGWVPGEDVKNMSARIRELNWTIVESRQEALLTPITRDSLAKEFLHYEEELISTELTLQWEGNGVENKKSFSSLAILLFCWKQFTTSRTHEQKWIYAQRAFENEFQELYHLRELFQNAKIFGLVLAPKGREFIKFLENRHPDGAAPVRDWAVH